MKRITVLLAACAMSSGASAQVPGISLPPYLVDRMPSWPSVDPGHYQPLPGVQFKITATCSPRGFNSLEVNGGAAGTTLRYSVSKDGTVTLAKDLTHAEHLEMCRQFKTMGIQHEVCR